MNLASFGTIAKNANNHVKSASIAKPTKDERGVSAQVTVFVRQPGLQLGENTRVVRGDDCLSHLELTPKHSLTFELPEQLGNRGTLLAVNDMRRRQEQSDKNAQPGDYPLQGRRGKESDLAHTPSV
jgi:hypothetical protein